MDLVLSNLKYVSADQSLIDMDVAGVIEGETIPFTYHADDAAPLSVEIKALLLAGGYDIAAYTAPALTSDQLVAYANMKQWAVATGGRTVTVNGAQTFFATTMDSMTLMDGKMQRLDQPNPPTVVNWQTGPTTFVAIDAVSFRALAIEIADFVQSTFDALPGIFTNIGNGTFTTTAQIDAVLAAL